MSVLDALGLDKRGRATKDKKIEDVYKAIRNILRYKFGDKVDKRELANIVGEELINSKLFGRDASNHAAREVTKGTTTHI